MKDATILLFESQALSASGVTTTNSAETVGFNLHNTDWTQSGRCYYAITGPATGTIRVSTTQSVNFAQEAASTDYVAQRTVGASLSSGSGWFNVSLPMCKAIKAKIETMASAVTTATFKLMVPLKG